MIFGIYSVIAVRNPEDEETPTPVREANSLE
jgi:hypothetical protein